MVQLIFIRLTLDFH